MSPDPLMTAGDYFLTQSVSGSIALSGKGKVISNRFGQSELRLEEKTPWRLFSKVIYKPVIPGDAVIVSRQRRIYPGSAVFIIIVYH